MMRVVIFASILLISLCGCNRLVIKPGTLKPGAEIYTTRGGYSMRPAVKEVLEKRGYDVKIGKVRGTSNSFVETEMFESETFYVPGDARYILKVSETRDKFRPAQCLFNGFWWWRYSVSLVDQKAGKELLSWSGRSCSNTAVRRFNKILDQLEIQENAPVED